MRKIFMLIFLTLWLFWASGPAVTGSVALRYINKPPLHYIMTRIVTGFVIYFGIVEDLLRGMVRIVTTTVRGP